MRSVLAIGALLVAMLAPSAARTEVVDLPPLVGGCTEGPTWEAIAACLTKARYVQRPLRQGLDWKLLELAVQRDPADKRPRYQGETLLALYTNQPALKRWVLGGHVSVSGSHYELLATSQVKIDKRDVWRFDLGQAIPTSVPTNDSGALTPALVRYNRTLYCGGRTPNCSDVFTACEVLVRGRAWYTFRGTAVPVAGQAAFDVVGDRGRAGRHCRMPERVSLYLP